MIKRRKGEGRTRRAPGGGSPPLHIAVSCRRLCRVQGRAPGTLQTPEGLWKKLRGQEKILKKMKIGLAFFTEVW